MKHLRLFETETDYENVANDLDLPCVSYTRNIGLTTFHKENYIIATYAPAVHDDSFILQLLHSNFDISQVKTMYIDDVEITPSRTYQFSPSEHELKVKIVFKRTFSDASYLFYMCDNLTSLDLSSFDTSNVTNMSTMFSYCSSLTSLDLSNFNTSKVTNMVSMFDRCAYLTSLDLSSFDTSNVTEMGHMFDTCSRLITLDLSSFETSNVTSMYYMFNACKSLTSITMIGDISNVIVSDMFNNITTNGTFYYNSAYDYSKIIAKLPSTWTAVAV